MYDVYGIPPTRTFRVMWMLEELGQPYRLITSPPQSEAARAVNPLGKVPALKDGETVLTDSVAIMTFLADRHGMLTAPAGSHARAAQDAMTLRLIDDLDAPLWAAARHSFIYPEDMRLAGMQAAMTGDFQRAVKKLVRHLDGSPGGRDYLMGAEFSLPDILATHCALWGRKAGLAEPQPVWDAYVARCMARPAFAAAQAKTPDA